MSLLKQIQHSVQVRRLQSLRLLYIAYIVHTNLHTELEIGHDRTLNTNDWIRQDCPVFARRELGLKGQRGYLGTYSIHVQTVTAALATEYITNVDESNLKRRYLLMLISLSTLSASANLTHRQIWL